MADEIKKMSSEETIKLDSAKETEKLQKETEKLDTEPQRTFPVSFTKDQIVENRYKVKDIIGQQSGESMIYLCEDIKEKKNVVLKLYRTGFSVKKDIIDKLIRLNHPDIVNVLKYGYINNQFYEVMEYAAGGNLIERLQENTFSEEELIKYIIPETLNGLKFCHENEVVHRDIKPANIFYRNSNKTDIVIGDFGISSLLDKKFSVKLSKRAFTSDYASPESFTDYIGKASDWYSLGMTLIHLYLGVSPFEGFTDPQIMHKHISEKIPLPDTLSDRFKNLLRGLLIKERKKRWGLDEIERWLKGEDVPVYEEEIAKPVSFEYKFEEHTARSTEDLAEILQTYPDREVVKKYLARGAFSKGIDRFDPALGSKIFDIEEREKDIDIALLKICLLLDSEMPYYLTPYLTPKIKVDTPEKLAAQIDKNWKIGKKKIFSGMISIWLKHKGYQEIVEKWGKVKNEYSNQQDRGTEIFLYLLDPELPHPEILIEPSSLSFGTIERISIIEKEIKLTNRGKRGYLFGTINLSKKIKGVTLTKDNTDLEIINIGLFPGESVTFKMIIDAKNVPIGEKYDFSIDTKTNASEEISLPVSFSTDYPEYSKKRAEKSLKIKKGVEIYTLRELAEYCYKEWSETDNIILTKKVIKWIKKSLKEEQIAKKVEEITKKSLMNEKRLHPQEYYRFLKLTGVIEEDRLFGLFKIQRIRELEDEQNYKIDEVRRDIWREVEDRRDARKKISTSGISVLGSIILSMIGCTAQVFLPTVIILSLGGYMKGCFSVSQSDPHLYDKWLPAAWSGLKGGFWLSCILSPIIGIVWGYIKEEGSIKKYLKDKKDIADITITPDEQKLLEVRIKTIEEETKQRIIGLDEEIRKLMSGTDKKLTATTVSPGIRRSEKREPAFFIYAVVSVVVIALLSYVGLAINKNIQEKNRFMAREETKGQLLFADSFSSNKNGWPTYKSKKFYRVFKNQRFSIYVNGTPMKREKPSSKYWYPTTTKSNEFFGDIGAYLSTSYSDFISAVKVEKVDGGESQLFGIFLGGSYDGGEGYGFTIDGNGNYKIIKLGSRSLDRIIILSDVKDYLPSYRYKSIVSGEDNAINKGNSVNYLKVVCNKYKVMFYCNNKVLECLKINSFQNTHGRVGFIVENYLHIHFDDLKIYSIGEGSGEVSYPKEKTGFVNNKFANIRSGPSTKYPVIGQARKGEKVVILSKEGNWYRIKYNGKTGYISGKLVNR